MRLVTYAKNGEEFVGVMSPVGDDIVPASEFGFNTRDMNSFIRQLDDRWLEAISATIGGKKTVKLGEVKLLSPIPRPERDVICLGLNYREHAAEAVKANREAYNRQWGQAVYFSKRVDTAVAPGDKINGHFDICTQLDYEAELAVIIGRDADHVKAKDAQNFILGYTILNDVSARNLQASHQQWYFGKSLDGFTPMGPCIVTAGSITYPPELGIQSKVNGELRQDSNTRLMIFNIDHIVSELSKGMTLKAGTIISTGTPKGVGMGFEPPKFLVAGDEVECLIEGIGAIKNKVV